MLGHAELVIKCDQESAIGALVNAVKAERLERIVLEKSPMGESRSKGAAETSVQQIQGQVRTMKDGLASRSWRTHSRGLADNPMDCYSRRSHGESFCRRRRWSHSLPKVEVQRI